MDQPVDEQTASDLTAIAESRRLTALQSHLLARNVTGAVRPNRDIYLWVLAHLFSAVFLCRQSSKTTFDPADCALEIVLAPGAGRRALLARLCEGYKDVRVTAEGVVAALPGLAFEATSPRIEDALAFGEFFITGADGALFGCFKQAVLALAPVPGSAAARDAVGILSRGIAKWRRERLPLGRHERLFSALIGFLLNRRAAERRGELLAFDDADIVAFWRQCVERGDRLMFRTAVERFRDFAALVRRMQALRSLRSAADLDMVAARLETAADDGFYLSAEGAAKASVLDVLKSFPDDPNALKGVERDLIATLAGLMPFHRERSLSVLRVLAFGPVQAGIANRLRRGGGGPGIEARVTCADAWPYDAVKSRFVELRAHLDALRLIAVALRFGDGAAVAGVDPDALAQTVGRGNLALKRLRRAGFERPRAELAEIFAGIDGAVTDCAAVVSDFTAEIDRLDERQALAERFNGDKPAFVEILTRAYT